MTADGAGDSPARNFPKGGSPINSRQLKVRCGESPELRQLPDEARALPDAGTDSSVVYSEPAGVSRLDFN